MKKNFSGIGFVATILPPFFINGAGFVGLATANLIYAAKLKCGGESSQEVNHVA